MENSKTPTENEFFKEEHVLKEDLILPIKLLRNKNLTSTQKLIVSFLIINRNDNDIEATSRLSISKNLGISLTKIKHNLEFMLNRFNFVIPTSSYTFIIDVEKLYTYLNLTNERYKVITSDVDMEIYNKVDEALKNWKFKKNIKIQHIVKITGITAIDIRANYPNFNKVVNDINKIRERTIRPIILDEKGNNMNTKKYKPK
jgi:hypothetical protein